MYRLEGKRAGGGERQRERERERERSLFMRGLDKQACFFSLPALVQRRDYSRSNYTCTHFLSCERERESGVGGYFIYEGNR